MTGDIDFRSIPDILALPIGAAERYVVLHGHGFDPHTGEVFAPVIEGVEVWTADRFQWYLAEGLDNGAVVR